MPLSLFHIIREGTRAVPATRFAVGIAGIVAVVALMISLNIDLRLALWGTIILLGLMVLLVIFSKLTQTAPEEFILPIRILMWAFVFLFITISMLLTTSVFFEYPINFKKDKGDVPPDSIPKTQVTEGELKNIRGINSMFYDYKGEIRNNLPNGKGIAIYANNLRMEGDFKDGHLHGNGKAIYPDSSIYVGEFVNDMLNGYGTMTIPNKATIKGYWADDNMEGEIQIEFNDGATYRGDTKKGELEGQGVLVLSDGTTYTGHFSNGNYDGHGKIVYGSRSPGKVYEGNFRDGEFDGFGTLWLNKDNQAETITNCPQSFTYQGEFRMGKKHGFGKCWDLNGEMIYEGQFDEDIPTGDYP